MRWTPPLESSIEMYSSRDQVQSRPCTANASLKARRCSSDVSARVLMDPKRTADMKFLPVRTAGQVVGHASTDFSEAPITRKEYSTGLNVRHWTDLPKRTKWSLTGKR